MDLLLTLVNRDQGLEPVAVSDVRPLLAEYHAARRAAEAKRAERDSVALVHVPLDHPRQLHAQAEEIRLRWMVLDEEMWDERHRATRAWVAYSTAIETDRSA